MRVSAQILKETPALYLQSLPDGDGWNFALKSFWEKSQVPLDETRNTK